jgi:hypothetical protein
MNAKIIHLKWIFWFFTEDTNAFVFYPFIIIKEEKDLKNQTLLNHEYFHIIQQRELFVIFFFILYGFYFIRNWFFAPSWLSAYMSIPFEVEAFLSQEREDYLSRPFHWKKFRKFKVADKHIKEFIDSQKDKPYNRVR